jgi:ATP-dependent DNA helicase PIF1
MERVQRPACTFLGKATGKFALTGERLPSPERLTLKVGAQVMFTKNDDLKRWVNGTIGMVVELDEDTIHVEIAGREDGDGGTHVVPKAKWETFRYTFNEDAQQITSVKNGSYVQYPLMLAWAVTIHKSQGKTLDDVCIDFGHGAFDYGQVYVALSRCRSLDNIQLLKPITPSDIKCDPVISRFYEALAGMGGR